MEVCIDFRSITSVACVELHRIGHNCIRQRAEQLDIASENWDRAQGRQERELQRKMNSNFMGV